MRNVFRGGQVSGELGSEIWGTGYIWCTCLGSGMRLSSRFGGTCELVFVVISGSGSGVGDHLSPNAAGGKWTASITLGS